MPNQTINPLGLQKDLLIETFVSYYGELYREKITTQINNAVFVWTYRDQYELHATPFLHQKQRVMKDFYKRLGIENINGSHVSDEMFTYLRSLIKNPSVQTGPYSFLSFNNPKIIRNDLDRKDVQELLGLPKHWDKLKRHEKWLYFKNNKESLLQRVTSAEKIWRKEYRDKCLEFEKELAKIDKQHESARAIRKKYESKQQQLLSNHIRNNSKRVSSQKASQLAGDLETIMLKGKDGLINCRWNEEKQNIMDFCKSVGLNYGASYNDYLNDTVFNYVFNPQLVAEYEKIQKHLEKELLEVSSIDKNIQTLSKVDFSSGNAADVHHLQEFIKDPTTTAAYCSPFTTTDGIQKTLCVIPITTSDQTLIHELNHVITHKHIERCENLEFVKSGVTISAIIHEEAKTFGTLSEYMDGSSAYSQKILTMDDISSSISTSKQLTKNNVTTLLDSRNLNEVITEYLSSKVAQIASNRGIEILSAQSEHNSAYSLTFPLLEPFLSKHEENLKDVMMSNNPLALEKFIGEENLNNLNSLVNEAFSMLLDIPETIVSLTEKKPNFNMSMAEFARLNPENLNYYEKKYLELATKSEEITRAIDAYVEKNHTTQTHQNINAQQQMENSTQQFTQTTSLQRTFH